MSNNNSMERFAKIEVEKSVSQIIENKEIDLEENATVYSGDEIIYKITLNNIGNIKADEIKIEDYIPDIIIPYYSMDKGLKGITKQRFISLKEEENIEDDDIVLVKEEENYKLTIVNMGLEANEKIVLRVYGIVKNDETDIDIEVIEGVDK